MKNKILIAALLFAGLLASCSNGFHEKAKNETSDIEEAKTYLIITDAQVKAARSINPNTTDEQKSDILNNLTNFTLKATKSGTSTETTLATAQSFNELKSNKILITAGRWYDMTLSAKLNVGSATNPFYINYSDTIDAITIKEGQDNTVSFELKTSDNGGLAITMNFSGNADKVLVSLKNANKTALTTSRDKTITTFTQKNNGTEVLNSFTYTLSRADTQENLPSGTYYLSFEFYKTGYDDVLNTLAYFVNIDSGFETKAELNVDLNEVKTFNINYQFYNCNVILTQNDGALPQGVSVKSGLLPEKLYITKTAEVTLPTMSYKIKDDNDNDIELVFGGWYKDNTFAADKKITGKFDRADSSITTLYALFYKPEIHVDAEASDGGSGWEGSPVKTIQAALDKIQDLNNPNIEWAIFVNGLLNECVTIADPSGKTFPAEKLFLIGNGTNGGIGASGKYEPLLTVSTSVPVILENFKIAPTGNVASNSGVALKVSGNVVLCGQTVIDGTNAGDHTSNQSAHGTIYVTGTLTMADEAKICNWNERLGAGIYVDGGTVVMEGSSSIQNCNSYLGGGIYLASGSVTMNDNAFIGGNDTWSCSASNGGGGVCVINGAFIMNDNTYISYCKSNGNGLGGAVYMEGGTFTMEGGSAIHSNEAICQQPKSGAVYLTNNAVFTMKGDSSISQNTAKTTDTSYDLPKNAAGAVYLDADSSKVSTFDMQGGSIALNKLIKGELVTNRAVYIKGVNASKYAHFKMSGDVLIYDNNDVYLGSVPSGKIMVTGTLTYNTILSNSIATITPCSYTNGMQILENDDEDDDYNDYVYETYNLFKATRPDTSILDWHTRSDGTISNYFVADDGHEFVDLDLPSGTLWAAYNFGETRFGEKASVPGKRTEWSNFSYGDPNNHVYYEQPWDKEWSIASVAEWQELIDNCYWKASDLLSLSSGNNYSVYYVFQAKSDEDKGNIKKTSYTTDNTYDENLDPCLKIVKSAYSSDAYYWPQLFVDSSYEDKIYPPSDYTPKPPLIDFKNTSSIIRTDWTNTQSTSNYTYHRLVISKNRTLVVTPNGDDSHTGLNALNANALKTIQGAINKIQNANYEKDCYDSNEIDWNILYFGEIPDDQKTISGYDSSKVKSLTIYSVTGTGSSTTKTAWDISNEGTIYINTVSVPEGFVLVQGATITEKPVEFGEYSAFKYVTDTNPITIQNFYICIHEVTQAEYETYCIYGGTEPSETSDKNQYPAYNISWYDAIVYCNLRSLAENRTPVYSVGKEGSSEQSVYPKDWDSIRSNDAATKYCGPDNRNVYWDSDYGEEVITINNSANGYRLPTNAEWEYAARGGNGLSGEQTQYSGSSTITEVSNGYYETIEKIMQHNENTLGIYDMNSAVNEWFLDPCGEDDYRRISTAQDPIDYNAAVDPNKRNNSYMKLGFRVVLNAPSNP